MIQIKPIPVGYPPKEANAISIRIMPFQTSAKSCDTYYELKNVSKSIDEVETVEILATGNIPINEEQFTAWADDNAFIENVVLETLKLNKYE